MFDAFKEEEIEQNTQSNQPKRSLTQKIEELILGYKNLKQENAELKEEIKLLTSKLQNKEQDISTLNEEVSSKDNQNDEIFSKIEEVLGL